MQASHNDEILPDGHPEQCAFGACKRRRRKTRLCNKHYMQARRQQNSDPYLITDDGITDMTAVDIAAAGVRLVRLTQRERELAARRILAAGGNQTTLYRRLALPTYWAARQLAERVTVAYADEQPPYGQVA
jgi:hypothetical protein